MSSPIYEIHLWFSLLLFASISVYYFSRPYCSIFHPGIYYIAFQGLVFTLRPLLQYYQDYQTVYFYLNFTPTEATKHLALLSTELTFVIVMGMVMRLARTPFQFRLAPSTPRKGWAMVAVGLFCAPTIAYSFYLSLGSFGSDNPLVSMQRVGEANITVHTHSTGYITDANQMAAPICVAIAWAFRFRLAAVLPLIAFLGLRMYFGWSRWIFVMTATSALLLYLHDQRRRWPTLKTTMLGVAILPIFHALGENRSLILDFLGGTTSLPKLPPLIESKGPLDNMDLANLEYLQFFVQIVPDQTNTYHYFTGILQIFTEPIPRILWPGKPLGAPIQLFNPMDFGNASGITPSLPGQAWMDLGLVGVVVWAVFAGWLLSNLYNYFGRRSNTRIHLVTYCVLLPLSVQWFRDGGVMTLFKFPLFFVIPLFFWWLATRKSLLHTKAAVSA